MPDTRTISAIEIKTFIECPRKHWYRYIGELPPIGPVHPSVVFDRFLRQALVKYHRVWPNDDSQMEDCVHQAIHSNGSIGRLPFTAMPAGEDAILRLVRRYHYASASNSVGGNCRCPLPVTATLETKRLRAVGDVVWLENGIVHVDQWQTVREHAGATLIQTAILHAGITQAYRGRPIQHRIVTLWPNLTVRVIEINEATFRQLSKVITGFVRQIERRGSREAYPCVNTCRRCRWTPICQNNAASVRTLAC